MLRDSAATPLVVRRFSNSSCPVFLGMTALHYATVERHLDVVRLLVSAMNKYHLSVDISDNNGMTPYIHANRLGFYDIVELLLAEGHCSRNQFDNKLHRSVDDWIQIGLRERKKNIKVRQNRLLEEYKIQGRIPSLMIQKHLTGGDKIQLPAITFSGGSTLSSNIRQSNEKEFLDPSASLAMIGSKKLVEDDQGEGKNLHLPHFISEHATYQSHVFHSQANKSVETAFALLGIQAKDNPNVSHAPHFQQTVADVGKGASFSGVMGDISTMMDVLSEQQTDSFRVVAKNITPPPAKTIRVYQEKKKVSTLAILFGRNGGTKRKGRTVGGKKTNYRMMSQNVKSKKRKGTGNQKMK